MFVLEKGVYILVTWMQLSTKDRLKQFALLLCYSQMSVLKKMDCFFTRTHDVQAYSVCDDQRACRD